ncbi:hypothetical protein K435DRAFT_772839 [Dendrothele bispora CBS 962.96]|uniref:Glyoxylate reductase n=1 Tax=Dendrothele bispora (strain CBS 962.96) TaxID=1314807 RepID=A0A4S8MXD5_DENBC|nr:hypothetical protein K435DRAFT_772839 [Dendrothele bispora CBS 962.96]
MSTSDGSISSAAGGTNTRLTTVLSHLSKKPRVVVCRDLGPDVMPLLRERNDIELVEWGKDNQAPPRDWLLQNVRGAAGLLIVFSEKIDAEVLEAAGPSLKVVSTMSVGYEHVQISDLAKYGVKLGYTPDVLTDAVADICVMLALMASRNAGESMSLVKQSKWPTWSPFVMCGPQTGTVNSPLSTIQRPSRTAGFLGFGRIAQATLSRLIPFGITDCIYTSNPSSSTSSSSSSSKSSRDTQILSSHSPRLRSLKSVSLDELARQSDILFILAPGGPKTYHVVNEEFLKKMQKHAVLVNGARGTLVDSDALAKALREKWIWGAGLDVVEGEPDIKEDHPLVKEPRCNVLPHIGSASFETRIQMATLAVRNVLAGVLGEEMPAELDLKANM